MSLILCGFPISNYYNQVKLQLLEKGIAFEERTVMIADVDKSSSPMGKVPYLLTPQGAVSESLVMMDYIEQAYPQPPLIPLDPFQATKVREINTYLCLYMELVVRELYSEAFFGGKVSEDIKVSTKKQLQKGLAALMTLTQFSPYIAGEHFTIADCAALYHFPLVSMATKTIYGEDFLAGYEQVDDYLKLLNQRPCAQQVKRDRVAFQKQMAK